MQREPPCSNITAEQRHIQSTKAHRLIARANRDGLIRVFVDGDIAGCVALEQALSERYGLEFCEVAPDLGDEPLPLKTLGLIGARYLRSVLDRGEHHIVGVGHGRTLAAAVEHLPRMPANGVQFVSLLGGVTRKFAANPFDVIHRIAERTGAESYVMPVPLLVNSVEDKAVLMAQSGMREVHALSHEASLLLLGIGTIDRNASLVSSGMIELSEIDKVRAAGAVGEALGVFFDAHGQPIQSDITARTLSFDFTDGKKRKTIAIAGGHGKAAAMDAVLKSGFITGLITDERTALDLTRMARRPKGQIASKATSRAAKSGRRLSKVPL